MSEMLKKLEEYLDNTPIEKLKSDWEAIVNELDKGTEEILIKKMYHYQYGVVRLRSIENAEVGLPVILQNDYVYYSYESKYEICHIAKIYDQGKWGSNKTERYVLINGGMTITPSHVRKIEKWQTTANNPNIKTLDLEITNPETGEKEYRMIDTQYWKEILNNDQIDKTVRFATNLVPYSKEWNRLPYAIEEGDKVVKVVDILPAKDLKPIDPKFTSEFTELSLFQLGLNLIKDDGQCATAESIIPRGKRIIQFNREGNWFCIKEDAGTRTVFNGIIYNCEILNFILGIIK